GSLPRLVSSCGLPPPATCPPSPYTTLFRSRVPRPAHRCDGARSPRGPCPFDAAGSRRSHLRERRSQARDVRPYRTRLLRPGGLRDRKSTRLNSSHVSISYAVVCLKKTTRCS